MTTWVDPPLSRREARQKVREDAGVDAVPVSEEELAAAAAAEEAARYSNDRVIRRNGAGGRRAQWAPTSVTSGPAPITSSFAPVQVGAPSHLHARPEAEYNPEAERNPAAEHNTEAEDNTDESQAEVVPELTMTRRELRALRERAAAAGQPLPDIVFLPNGIDTSATPVVVVPAAEPLPNEALTVESGPVQAGPIQAGPIEARPASDSAAPIPDLIEPSSADWTFRATRSAAQADPVQPVHGELEYIEAEIVEESEPESYPKAPASEQASGDSSVMTRDHHAAEPVSDAPETLNPFDALFRPAAPEATDVSPTADAGAKPYGHWTTQAALDDAAPSIDGFLSRDVGVTTGAITTHALVLPSIPESGDQLLAPLTTTGEIMVTGSIDLPRSFGSTGAHPARFDHSDVDALIEESDREDAESTSAPVRAIRAVSSTSSTRGVIEAPAKPKSKLPFIGGLVFAGLILVAGAFVAAALIFNVF